MYKGISNPRINMAAAKAELSKLKTFDSTKNLRKNKPLRAIKSYYQKIC